MATGVQALPQEMKVAMEGVAFAMLFHPRLRAGLAPRPRRAVLAAAGQTVPHLHVHVIPRRVGDVDDPRGGVRWVVAARARYWSA